MRLDFEDSISAFKHFLDDNMPISNSVAECYPNWTGQSDVVRRLKWQLLAQGVFLPRHTHTAAENTAAKLPQQVRSGASNGLEMILPGSLWANAPVASGPGAPHAPRPELVAEEGSFYLRDHLAQMRVPVTLAPEPAYYQKNTRGGTPMNRVGQMCADRIGFGLTNSCYFWQSSRRCQFCSIGVNNAYESQDKTWEEIDEVLSTALLDPVAAPRHLLVSGGTPADADWGIHRFAEIGQKLRSRYALDMYLMTVPPKDLGQLALLHESGYTEIAINIEVADPSNAARMVPGKHNEIGLPRYLEALEQATRHWGARGDVRSLLVVGLESMTQTLRGVEQILTCGAAPVLSVFRPIVGSRLQQHAQLDVDWLDELFFKATELAQQYKIPLGPACNACKTNILALNNEEGM